MRTKEVKHGFLNLSKGFEIALEEAANEEKKRLLKVFEGAYEKHLGYPLKLAKKVQSPNIVNQLSQALKDYSPAYMRNLRCKLYDIIERSPIVEDLSHISEGWFSEIRKFNPKVKEDNMSLRYWGEFVESNLMSNVVPVKNDTLLKFQNWLADQKDLARNSTAMSHRASIRDLLKDAGLFAEQAKTQVVLSTHLQNEWEKISIYALNQHITTEQKNSIKKRRYGANLQPITEKTLQKLEYQVSAWIRFLDERGDPTDIISFANLLQITFLEDFLEEKCQKQEYTLETALTTLFNCKTIVRFAVATGVISMDLEAFSKEIDVLEKNVRDADWKDGVNKKLKATAKAGKFPSMVTLHSNYLREVQTRLPKWHVILKELRAAKCHDDISSKALDCLEEIRGAVLMGMELYMSPRIGDIVDIPPTTLRRIEEFFNINWVPEKTFRKHYAPEVDVCIPHWMTGLLHDYLLVRRFLHDKSTVLFPAVQRAQQKSERSLKDGKKASLSYGQFQDLSKKYLGEHMNNNLMRKIVGRSYKVWGLSDLHQTLGHSKKSFEAILTDPNTEIEREHYILLDDTDRAEIARRNYGVLARKLEVAQDLDLSFLDSGTKKILQARFG